MIGFNGQSLHGDGNATLRWSFFAETTESAEVVQGDGYARGVFTRRIQDVEGRGMHHERNLILLAESSSLVVIDRVVPDSPGLYKVGPNWHFQQVLSELDNAVWVRDGLLGPNMNPFSNPAPLWGKFASSHSGELERVTELVGHSHSQHLAYFFQGQIGNKDAIEFISVWKPYPGKTAPFAPIEYVEASWVSADAGWFVQLEDQFIEFRNGVPYFQINWGDDTTTSGWRTTWFGRHYGYSPRLFYHENLGFSYLVHETGSSAWLWFFEGDLGWTWVHRDHYPAVYSVNYGWLLHRQNSRCFFNFSEAADVCFDRFSS
jgi:hypothetical protein